MRSLAVASLTVLLLAGCSGESDPSGSGTSDSTTSAAPKPTGPACADIWEAGETLPDDYTSCVLDGVAAPQETYECQDGGTLVAFNDAMYAVTGGTIVQPKVAPMQDTEEYGKAYSACTGE